MELYVSTFKAGMKKWIDLLDLLKIGQHIFAKIVELEVDYVIIVIGYIQHVRNVIEN